LWVVVCVVGVRLLVAVLGAAVLVIPSVALADEVPVDDVIAPVVDTTGVVDTTQGIWYLRDVAGSTTSFYYGNPADAPFMGDWDCDGVDTPGLYRKSDGYVYLRNSNTQGIADVSFYFGNPGDVPLAGDFNGDGCDTVSLYRPSQGMVYVINRLGSRDAGLGKADFSFAFGNPDDVPFVGDFDGDGYDTVGMHRPSSGLIFLRNTLAGGTVDAERWHADPGDVILAGAWGSEPGDRLGRYRPSSATFVLRTGSLIGEADVVVSSSGRSVGSFAPVAGAFGALSGNTVPGIVLGALPRSAWGAAPPIQSRMKPHVITELTVHHAGDQSRLGGPVRYRSWQSWHQDRGWGDLAYHYIVGTNGRVYEARDVRYAGDTGTNYDPAGHFLVVVEGNFEVDVPTPAQIDALIRVLAWASIEFDVSPATISGHRDHAATLCPGGNLYPYVASGGLEHDVRSLLASGG
jgi:hypothetical protein